MVCQEAQVYHWQTRKNVFFNVMAEVETRTVKIWFAWSSEEDQAPTVSRRRNSEASLLRDLRRVSSGKGQRRVRTGSDLVSGLVSGLASDLASDLGMR